MSLIFEALDDDVDASVVAIVGDDVFVVALIF
jgi:hypothetical protein